MATLLCVCVCACVCTHTVENNPLKIKFRIKIPYVMAVNHWNRPIVTQFLGGEPEKGKLVMIKVLQYEFSMPLFKQN